MWLRVSAGRILLLGERLEVSKAGVWMCDFRDGGCVGLTVCWDVRCGSVWLMVVVHLYIGGSVFLLDCVYP